jgi:hypothetical protein
VIERAIPFTHEAGDRQDLFVRSGETGVLPKWRAARISAKWRLRLMNYGIPKMAAFGHMQLLLAPAIASAAIKL